MRTLRKSQVEHQQRRFQDELGRLRGRWFSIVEINARTGIPKGSLHRYLQREIAAHNVERSRGKYRIVVRQTEGHNASNEIPG